MVKLFLCILLLAHIPTTLIGREWFVELAPSQIKVCSSSSLRTPSWFMKTYGAENMINLSFFTHRSYVPPYKDHQTSNYRNTKKWPFVALSHDDITFHDPRDLTYAEYESLCDNSVYIMSGFPLLLEAGVKTKLSKSAFTKRRCARTVLALHSNGSVIIYVTDRASLSEVQETLLAYGCTDAINFDGGSSTFLYLKGKRVYATHSGSSYPNVLYWD